MNTAALIQNHEKTDNGITLKFAFKNLMSKPVNAKAVYEIADKTDGETCLRVSEKITPGDTNQKTITIYYPDIPVDYTLNAYLTDSGDTVISNISSTEPIYFCRSYDFEDFVNSESGMPEHLMKNGYSAAAYDSSSGGNYLSILSSGSKNGFSLVNVGGENMMSKKILLSAKVRVPDNTECSFFNFNEYSSTSTYGLTFTDDNEIMYGDLYLGRYENYQWHSVALLLDTTLQTADVFLDGDLIADNLNWNWIPYTYIHMYAQSLSSDTKTYTGVDDFMITDNPAYFSQNANDLSGIKVQSLTVSDSEGTSSTTGKGEKTISAKASNTASESRNAELIAAVYEGNAFKKVSITPIENLNAGKSAVYDTAVTLENDNQNLKAFVWNSLSQMKPAHKH